MPDIKKEYDYIKRFSDCDIESLQQMQKEGRVWLWPRKMKIKAQIATLFKDDVDNVEMAEYQTVGDTIKKKWVNQKNTFYK